jgi:hypothetical protein
LSTIFASAAAGYASAHVKAPGFAVTASIHGYTTAFGWAAAIFALGLIVATVILPRDGAARARSAQAEARSDLSLSLESA